MITEQLVAPFPYFGGKRTVAGLVWERFGDVPNYVEPFFGSGAVLLGRPSEHTGHVETVNDLDGMVANFWRAVAAAPDVVARYADWPVNENDLTARHIWLVQRKESLQNQLETDPDFYDAKVAGWWCWGICCWIGSGWCSGEGPWTVSDGQLVHLGDAGRGVNRQLVHLGDAGQGVNRKLVHLGDAGRDSLAVDPSGAVSRKRPLLTNDGVGIVRDSGGVYEWMRELAERLRRVRVCCGDWARVCGPTPTVKQGLTGIFLDPPYGEGRAEGLYVHDSFSVAEAVRRWCLDWQEDSRMRIALCGYDDVEMPDTWEMVRWSAKGGYGCQGNGRGAENRHREVIWFSPHCLKPDRPQQTELPL